MSETAPNTSDAAGRKTGAWQEPDPHGGTMSGEYGEGQRQGRWVHTFADGRVRSESEYVDGALAGPVTWYRSTGGLLQKGSFVDDEKHGFWQRWTAAGVLIDEGEFDRGVKTGEWTYYAPDGSVKKRTMHKGR